MKIILFCLLIISQTVHAQKILIEQGTNSAIKITILANDNPTWNQIAQIIMNDLYNSGLFDPRVSTISNNDDNYRLAANIAPEGNRLKANFTLTSISTNQIVFTGNVYGLPQQIRDIAHYISNQLFKHITGVNGDFASKILYVTKINQEFALQRADYDGANPHVLLTSKAPILSPRFAPNGQQIAYVSFEQGKPQIFIQDIKSGKRNIITNYSGLNGAPAFSPDGQKLAFVLSKDGNPEIYVMNLASKNIKRITNNLAIDTEPTWGADSQTLYFTSDRSGRPQIYKQQIGNNQAERVTFDGNYNANPKISVDGISLVTVHRPDGYTNFQIGVHNLERKTLQIISTNQLNDAPTISPNGGMVIYVAKQGGKELLMLSSTNGRVTKQLINIAGDVREPNWSFK